MLSGQLRALLTERSRKADPLLLELAKKFGHALEIYAMPGVDDPSLPEAVSDDFEFHISGFPITLAPRYFAQEKYHLKDLINKKIIKINDKVYTITNLIEWYANWGGGSHYSRQIPEEFNFLLSMNIFGSSPISNLLTQVGEATLASGLAILRKMVEFEIHAVLVIPGDSAPKDTFLIDAKYEGSNMRLSLMLSQRLVPIFSVTDLQGMSAKVQGDRLVDWDAPRYFLFSLGIDDDLSTVLEIYINGERIGRSIFSEPLFVFSQLTDYEVYHNRAADGENQDFCLGLSSLAMYGKEMTPVERANLLIYFEKKCQDDNLKIILYNTQSFGYSERGSKNLHMEGEVKRLEIGELGELFQKH